MTPAQAAREVAEKWRMDYRLSHGDEDARLSYAVWQAFAAFADALDQAEPPSPCGEECADGIACPLADDWPEAHSPRR
jgi:hypothetical protein